MQPLQSQRTSATVSLVATSLLAVMAVCWTGCASSPRAITFDSQSCGVACDNQTARIAYPQPSAVSDHQPVERLHSAEPVTLSNFDSIPSREMTLDECVATALANSEVMQKLGGVVVNSPAATTTLYDPALAETSAGGVEAALSAFDAQFTGGFLYDRSERRFNNLFFGGGAANLVSNVGNFNLEIAKQTATGTSFAARSIIDYNRSNSPANTCLLYTSPSPRDQRGSRMPSSA